MLTRHAGMASLKDLYTDKNIDKLCNIATTGSQMDVPPHDHHDHGKHVHLIFVKHMHAYIYGGLSSPDCKTWDIHMLHH